MEDIGYYVIKHLPRVGVDADMELVLIWGILTITILVCITMISRKHGYE
jgi:hypothetical protein